MDACWSFIEFVVLKWSMRPPVRISILLRCLPAVVKLSTVDRMKLSLIVLLALLAPASEAVPLSLWSSSIARRSAWRDLIDSLERPQALQTSPKNRDVVVDWRRDRRQSEPPNWLGSHAAGSAWDAYVRMLRQEQFDVSDQPRRTSNPVNFLGKRAVYFK